MGEGGGLGGGVGGRYSDMLGKGGYVYGLAERQKLKITKAAVTLFMRQAHAQTRTLPTHAGLLPWSGESKAPPFQPPRIASLA